MTRLAYALLCLTLCALTALATWRVTMLTIRFEVDETAHTLTLESFGVRDVYE